MRPYSRTYTAAAARHHAIVIAPSWRYVGTSCVYNGISSSWCARPLTHCPLFTCWPQLKTLIFLLPFHILYPIHGLEVACTSHHINLNISITDIRAHRIKSGHRSTNARSWMTLRAHQYAPSPNKPLQSPQGPCSTAPPRTSRTRIPTRREAGRPPIPVVCPRVAPYRYSGRGNTPLTCYSIHPMSSTSAGWTQTTGQI